MMGQKSLTVNSIFYIGNQLLNILFPLFTGVYVARVLLPVNIGEVAYAQNIVQYFVIFSFLGLPTYGLREISRARSNHDQLNRVFSELFIINSCSTVFFLLLYIILILSTDVFRNSISLYSIVGCSIALNFLNISWLYDGLEEFQIVATRNAIFKFLCVILLVVFVKTQEDYLWYAAISVVGIAGNYLVNMLFATRHVSFTLKGLSFIRHIKPILYLVAVNLAIEIYTLVDVTMLGLMREATNVAFYSYGSRMSKILLTIVNSFTMVIVPRMVLYYKEGKIDEYNLLLSKTFKLILLLSVPMMIGLQFVADDLVTLLYGQVYKNSALVLKILSSLLVISPIGYLLGSRVMLATDQESKMLISVSIGAIANLIGNYILIQKYAEFGAAVASVISEIIVMIVYVSYGRKHFSLSGVLPSLVKVLIASVGMTVALYYFYSLHISIFLKLSIELIVGVAFYFGILLALKETSVSELMETLKKRLS